MLEYNYERDVESCIVLLHIPRTGGTTLRRLLLPRLLRRMRPEEIFLIDIGPEYGCRTGSLADLAALDPHVRGQLRFVTGRVDYVGVFEQLDDVVDDMCALAGIDPVNNFPWLNNAPRLVATSDHDRRLIAAHNWVDSALYAIALGRWIARDGASPICGGTALAQEAK
jgi:hypothetical protein